MSFILDLPIPYGFLPFSHCHGRPTRFTVHYVKGFVFGALHFTHPPVSRFTLSKACRLWCFALHPPTRFTVHSVKGLPPLVLCTTPAHPFHGSLRQRLCLWCFALHLPTRFTVHFVKDFVFGALHFTTFIFSIACFLNDSLP